MTVTHQAQGKDIGRLLVEHCLWFCRKKEISTLILHSNTALTSAIRLYEKYGFKEIKLEETFYKRANIKMKLEL